MPRYLDIAREHAAAARTEGSGRWFVAFAKTVGERVLFHEDGMVPPNSEGLVTYSRSELEYIKPLADDVKQRIHRAKKAFGGTVPAPPLGKEG